MTLRTRRWALLIVALLLALPRPLRAEDGEVPFTLAVDSDLAAISFAELSPRLSADLGEPVLPGAPGRRSRVAVTVRFRAATRELVVRADHGGGRVLERTVVVADGEEATTATLLAENLARDEARELLDDLAVRQKPAAPPPAPASPIPAIEARPRPPEREIVASAALAYPIATNFAEPDATSHLDFALLYGHVGAVRGLQLSSGGAWSSREVRGLQLTAFGGYARRVAGAQLAGAVAVGGEAAGVQLAGGLAFASTLEGAQIAPVNIAKEATGVQLGAVNIAKKVKGLQLGVVNVADDVDGTALGVVSIARNGVHPLAFASNLSFWNAGIKFQAGYVYTSIAVTYGTLETRYRNVAMTGALGGHIPLDAIAPKLDVEPEANIVHVVPARASDVDGNLWLGALVTAGYSFARHFRVFTGGGARFPLIVAVGKEIARPEVVGGLQF